jgi:hypothetical protein
MNITKESQTMEDLMKAMEQMDKEVKVERQESCNLDDGECLTCGS